MSKDTSRYKRYYSNLIKNVDSNSSAAVTDCLCGTCEAIRCQPCTHILRPAVLLPLMLLYIYTTSVHTVPIISQTFQEYTSKHNVSLPSSAILSLDAKAGLNEIRKSPKWAKLIKKYDSAAHVTGKKRNKTLADYAKLFSRYRNSNMIFV